MLLSSSNHRYVYLIGLSITLCSLPFSVFGTSVGVITIAINFLFEQLLHFDARDRLKGNIALWFSIAIFLPVLYSSFYSANTAIAIKELRLWLPFLLVPPIISLSKPFSTKEFKWMMLLFVLAVFVATIISTIYYFLTFQKGSFDIREISIFISHIRFSLMVNLAIVLLIYFIWFDKSFLPKIKIFMAIGVFWFALFLILLQSLTGIVMLVLLLFFSVFWIVKKSSNSIVKFVVAVAGLTFLFILVSIITHRVDSYYTRNYIDFKKLPATTINGNPYQHDTSRLVYENGNLVYVNVCTQELRSQWNLRSHVSFDSVDSKGQHISQTLLRYMTSLGLTKDSVGVSKLDGVDVSRIENGFPNSRYRESRFGLGDRLYQLLWQFDSYRNEGTISNSSVIQRLVFVKAACFVIGEHPVWGVGWGDVWESLNQYYSKYAVNLAKEHRFMPHNQYLTVWAGAGIVGLTIFLCGLILPFWIKKRQKFFLPLYFQIMIMLSMLNEDTFETHIGITFAVLFGSLFIFGYSFDSSADDPKTINI